jgi:hypothetical protein
VVPCGNEDCIAQAVGASYNYADHSDPDIQITVNVTAAGVRTFNIHFNPDPAAGNWDYFAKLWVQDLDARLRAGNVVELHILTGTNGVFPQTFILGGSRQTSYTSSNLATNAVQLTSVDDLTIQDSCEGINALFAKELTATAATFEVKSGDFTAYTAVAGSEAVQALRVQPSDCTLAPEEIVLLCDADGQFLRHYARTVGGAISVYDTGLDGFTPRHRGEGREIP